MSNPLDPGYFEAEELRTFGFKTVGHNVRISKLALVHGADRIEIGDDVRIDAFTAIVVPAEGWLKMGSRIHVATNCLIGARGGVILEGFCGVSHGARLLSATDDFSGETMMSYEVPAHVTNPTVGTIEVGRHAVIGSNCVVLPGVVLNEGAVVGALSLVRDSLPPWAIYAGVPARRIKDRSRGLLALEAAIGVPAAGG